MIDPDSVAILPQHRDDSRITPHEVVSALRLVPIDSIKQHPENNNVGAVAEIAESIDEFGFFDPITVQASTGYIITGNHSWSIYRQRGATEVPALVYDVDDITAKRMMAAHNKTNRRGHDDPDKTLALLNSLIDEAGTEYAICGTGWHLDDLDDLKALCAGDTASDTAPDLFDPEHNESGDQEPGDRQMETGARAPEAYHHLDASRRAPSPDGEAITQAGDVWIIGDHRLICGDSHDIDIVSRLTAGEPVNLAFTSPPYASQRAYDENSGFKPVSPDDYVQWFSAIADNVRACLAEDGSWFVNIKEHIEDGQRHLYVKDLTIAHVRQWGWKLIDELCWTSHGFPGRYINRFKNAWEPVFHFAKTADIKFHALANGIPSDKVYPYSPETSVPSKQGKAGKAGIRRPEGEPGLARPSNVLRIGSGATSGEHPAEFPVALPAWFIRAYTDAGDFVLDPFCGSGTTMLAAHAEERKGLGIEISPAYCDIIARRMQQATGIMPVRESTGELHDFVGNP